LVRWVEAGSAVSMAVLVKLERRSFLVPQSVI